MISLSSDTFSIILSFIELEDYHNLPINKQFNKYLNKNKKKFYNKKLKNIYKDDYILKLIPNSEKYYFKYKNNYYNDFIIHKIFEYLIQNDIKNIIKFQIFCYDYIFSYMIQRSKNIKVRDFEKKQKMLILRKDCVSKIRNSKNIDKKDKKIKLLFNITIYIDRNFKYY